MSRKKIERKPRQPLRTPTTKLGRDEQNRQAFRDVVKALEKVKSAEDRDRILEAVGCLLGAR